jgi:glycosyltransferase involved in cell wall biosynthesis
MSTVMNAADPQRIAVLIPALNEAQAIRDVVASALAVCPNVIVVDDGSTDGTGDRVADLPVTVIRHATPQGKGEALRAGFRSALASGFAAVVTMDGDGQHIAADIPRMLVAARRYPDHIVIAARLIDRDQQPASRRRACDFADWGLGWATGQRLVDTQSGQRYYPRAVMELTDVATRHGFVFESEILMEANWRLGTRMVAVPIQSRYHGGFRASHIKPVRDFLRITRRIVWKILCRGGMLGNYVRSRRATPLIVETD